MGEWVGLGITVGFKNVLRGLDILLNDLFNKMRIWD